MSGCVTDCSGEDGLYVLYASVHVCVRVWPYVRCMFQGLDLNVSTASSLQQ